MITKITKLDYEDSKDFGAIVGKLELIQNDKNLTFFQKETIKLVLNKVDSLFIKLNNY